MNYSFVGKWSRPCHDLAVSVPFACSTTVLPSGSHLVQHLCLCWLSWTSILPCPPGCGDSGHFYSKIFKKTKKQKYQRKTNAQKEMKTELCYSLTQIDRVAELNLCVDMFILKNNRWHSVKLFQLWFWRVKLWLDLNTQCHSFSNSVDNWQYKQHTDSDNVESIWVVR